VVGGDDATSDAGSCVSGLEALSVFSAAQVVGLGVHHESASEHRVEGTWGQRNAAGGEADGRDAAVVGFHVAEVAGVTTRVTGGAVGALNKGQR